MHATAEDLARFGYLYLRDGVWDGRRILPDGLGRHGAGDGLDDPDDGRGYGWQWWVTADEHGSFWANGYEGQSILVSPGLDLVVVRIGRTDASHGADLFDWRAAWSTPSRRRCRRERGLGSSGPGPRTPSGARAARPAGPRAEVT